ncbi:Rieske 2Fe-2S domain-containing protein [Rhodobacteraceae bacterium]|nr:Rieske 2Fe-2S domain-containing protein [Paracoccaceae bacterium]
MLNDLKKNWYPIASSLDVPKRHVYHAQLLGREFAVWRADDGNVNVWENRCLHRGVRLSIGINEGTELRCQYHGWRYANRTAGCTYIPAHPADAPSRTICNNTYPVYEFMGMIWSGEEAIGDIPSFKNFDEFTVLRPIPINAHFDLVKKMVISKYSQLNYSVKEEANGAFIVTSGIAQNILFFVQPQDSKLSVLRGVVNQALLGTERFDFLKKHNQILQNLRCKIENISSNIKIDPMVAQISQVSVELSKMPEKNETGRKADLRVKVSEKIKTAEGIVSIKLEFIDGQLPTFQPGAHIDLHLQNGLVRQYSLVNGPGETNFYRIGVKLEEPSAGGSSYIHNNLRVGDVLACSTPRNNFPLRRDSIKTIFIAGGIGLTPLLAMSQALDVMGLDYEFHYFVQNDKHIAFGSVLNKLKNKAFIHEGFSPDSTVRKINDVLKSPKNSMNLYVCGPGPMLEATRQIAAELNWPNNSIHFEYFKNSNEIDDSSSFEIELARSALSLNVPSGKSILEVLRENGVDLPSSCEQGACGTCKVGVIKGSIDHQDVYLNESERSEGNVMMTCVSRSLSKSLILDI